MAAGAIKHTGGRDGLHAHPAVVIGVRRRRRVAQAVGMSVAALIVAGCSAAQAPETATPSGVSAGSDTTAFVPDPGDVADAEQIEGELWTALCHGMPAARCTVDRPEPTRVEVSVAQSRDVDTEALGDIRYLLGWSEDEIVAIKRAGPGEGPRTANNGRTTWQWLDGGSFTLQVRVDIPITDPIPDPTTTVSDDDPSGHSYALWVSASI